MTSTAQRAAEARRQTRAGVGLLLVAGGWAAAASCAERVESHGDGPHLILLTVDTLRADRLGYNGWKAAQTPTIDRLAIEGRAWETVIASAPVTLSAMATLMTGLDPTEHGARYNGFYELEQGVETLAEVLTARGYTTGAVIGNFALERRFGIAQGFHTYDDEMTQRMQPGEAQEQGDEPAEQDPDWWARHVSTQRVQRFADEVTDAGIAWLETAGEGPFFIWLHYMDPHGPYAPPEPYAGLPDAYDGEVAFVDAEIGRFLAAFDERFGDTDALVVFTSDHGESLGEHGVVGHVFEVYDQMLCVPLILRRPGVIEAGQRDTRPLRARDVRATILEALSPAPRLDEDAPAGGWFAYSETFQPVIAKRGTPVRTVRNATWKLIERDGRHELYRIANDPGERNDLAGRRPGKLAELAKLLEQVGAGRATIRSSVGEEEIARLRALGYVE